MIKHLVKLIWNRKRANFLIALEIFFSFLVLFIVIVLAVYFSDNYRRPLGFNYENVWNIGIAMNEVSHDNHSAEQGETVRQIFLALQKLDEIVGVGGTDHQSFNWGGSHGEVNINGSSFFFRRNYVTDEFATIMGVKMIRGRWFSKEDDGSNKRPVVINRLAAEAIFGKQDPVGKEIPGFGDWESVRIVGVIDDFRHGGDFAQPENILFYRMELGSAMRRLPEYLVIKLHPGTTRQFEEKLVSRLHEIARDWSFHVQPLDELRETSMQVLLIPLGIAGLVAAFLMIMVALGLTGVLWQNVTQRTKEFGLRRAKGATRQRIYRQILGELFIVTSFGLLAGVLVVVQVPLLDLIGVISMKVYLFSLIGSVMMIYFLTLLCGLYPSWLATKVHPADALHYE
ncbi:MAG: ABC transporter permease [Acidobacteria bacterium]|nr:ABC transporter permease [Acidobacteriota bacterium]